MKKTFLFFALFLLFACTKFGKNITVKGYVLNPITGEGIEGIEVSLLKGTNGLPGGFKAVKTVFTDANGCYELNKFGLTHYDVRAQAGDRYDLGWYMDGEKVSSSTDLLSVKKGKTMHADYHTVDYGLLNFDIQNLNCEGSSDLMQFRYKYQFDESFKAFSSDRLGCYTYVSSSPGKLPIGMYIYQAKVIRPSGTTFVYDTVIVDDTGNSTVYIHY